MSIDPNTLPDGAAAEVVDTYGPELRYIHNGGTRIGPASTACPMNDRVVTRVFVPVPGGVAYEDALRAVEDARPWVEWDGRTLPDGTRVRADGPEASVSGPVVRHVSKDYRIRGAQGFTFNAENAGRLYVHPDDVPDPDADLIERITREIDKYRGVGDETRIARAVLAVVREAQR